MAEIVACPSCDTKNRVPASASGHPRCASCKADLPWMIDVGESDFAVAVEQARLPVLVDCWAAWCGPCLMMAPILESVAATYAGRLKIVKVDMDANPGIGARLGVRGIPAMFLYVNGNIVEEIVGARPEHELRMDIERALKKA
jgi:thioredoxin 2